MNDMVMKTDTSKVLMSEALRGVLPEMDGSVHPASASEHVVVIVHKRTGAEQSAMVGVLRGVLLGAEPEVEFRCQLKEALDIIESSNVTFVGFELHHGERVINVSGPFSARAARIDEIDVVEQLCTLGVHLQRQR